MNPKKLLIEMIFWLHFPIVALWFGLFVVPLSLWPQRITVHFWYIAGIMVIQLLWSVIVFRKLDIICPLTTVMQSLRGYPLKHPQNDGHSFIAELLERLGVPLSYRAVNILLVVTLILVTVQYLWFRS